MHTYLKKITIFYFILNRFIFGHEPTEYSIPTQRKTKTEREKKKVINNIGIKAML